MAKKFVAGKSLFSSTDAHRALAGVQKRNQTVLTPRPILDACLRALGDGQFDLDPCTTAENPVGARSYFLELGTQLEWSRFGKNAWVNPPYDSLEEWMKHAYGQSLALSGPVGSYLLIPLRPQRGWWVTYAARANWIRTLAPFPFVGQKHTFPAPLVLLGYCVPPVEYIPSWFLDNTPDRNLITGALSVNKSG
jgi:hypothetical protein